VFRVDFLQHLKCYSRDRLPELKITGHDAHEASGGFLFTYRGDGADLFLDGRQIGTVALKGGQIIYDPSIEISEGLSLDRWVEQARQRAGALGADRSPPAGLVDSIIFVTI
jgi:hypothetical protein